MAEFDRDYFVGAFRRMAEAAEVNRDEWTKLDGDIGDGDHGINMSIGFREVSKQLDALPDATDVGGLFKLVGMTLLRKVGGASGPLYGTFFLRLAAALPAEGADPVAFGLALRAGLDGVLARGKASVGDKTMVDALSPAVDAYEATVSDEAAEALEAAARAAAEGRDATIPLVARKGRASYLGDRSAGHQDPGATSVTMLVEAAARTLG